MKKDIECLREKDVVNQALLSSDMNTSRLLVINGTVIDKWFELWMNRIGGATKRVRSLTFHS